jgi:FAD/FMN-containing dehydrogenase
MSLHWIDSEDTVSLRSKYQHSLEECGGTISGERGVGKLKRNLLKLMYGEKGFQEMFQVKKILDP